MSNPKFNVGDKVKTVLHGEKVIGTVTKYVPGDPTGLIYHFKFNDGTSIVMEKHRVNREVVSINDPLPEWMEKKIKRIN